MIIVVLVIHVMLTITLIGVVLVQKSEGGGLGIGGGGGMSGFMTGRSTANLLTRTTAFLAAGFMLTTSALSMIVSLPFWSPTYNLLPTVRTTPISTRSSLSVMVCVMKSGLMAKLGCVMSRITEA